MAVWRWSPVVRQDWAEEWPSHWPAGARIWLFWPEDPDKLTETAREIESLGGRCLPVVCDISDEASVQNAVETVVNHYKKVDILVNNAGNGGPSIPTVDMPQEIFDKVVNLDLCSLFRVMKAFGKVMVEAGYGRIINIASAMGMVGNLGVPLAGYQAAKGGVINLTRAAAAEWATRGDGKQYLP